MHCACLIAQEEHCRNEVRVSNLASEDHQGLATRGSRGLGLLGFGGCGVKDEKTDSGSREWENWI